MANRSGEKKVLGGEWLLGLILVAAVLLVYSPVRQAGMLWDDDAVVTANHVIVGPLGVKEIWTTAAADICPFTLTTFWLEHKLWGMALLPYHLVNVFLHAAGAVLLWQVLRSLRVPGAWLGAALWALHPVEVESVAWMVEMKNTESGLFFLLAMLFFIQWLKAEAGGGWNYALALLFTALAMASKSSTVILPGVLCLCAWWLEGRWQWRNLARTAPMFLLSIGAAISSVQMQALYGAVDPHWTRTWPERIVTAGDAVWFYLGKLLWPHPLIAIYPRWRIDGGQWTAYLPLLLVVIVLFVLWRKCGTWGRPWFFTFAYFLLALLPVLGLANISFFRYTFVADHFQYLASMGPLALAGAGVIRLGTLVVPNAPRLSAILGAGLLLILGMLSWRRVCVFQNEKTLWSDTLAKNPACWVGYDNLGNVFNEEGHADKAMAQFRKALEINPDYAEAHNNLGNAFLRKGQLDQAITEYQKGLEIESGRTETINNLGVAFLRKGEWDRAIGLYREAVEIDPYFGDAYNNLGDALLKKGEADQAIPQFQKAVEFKPELADAHDNYGNALMATGQTTQAIAEYQKALEINPKYAAAHNDLGAALLKKGETDQATDQFQKALESDPNFSEAYFNLGVVFANKQQLGKAIIQYRKALKMEPDYANAHNALGIALAQTGHMDEAIAEMQEALRLRPDRQDFQQNLATALETKRKAPAR